MHTLLDCKVVSLQKVSDRRGNLTVVQSGLDVPFHVKRVFYIYDIPGGESRGGHAHKTLYQFVVCMMGSFEVVIDDGVTKDIVRLNRSYTGLLIPSQIWAAEQNFSSGGICLVAASEFYNESDYIRTYEDFLRYRKSLEG